MGINIMIPKSKKLCDPKTKTLTIIRWTLWWKRRSHALSIGQLQECQEHEPNNWESRQFHGTHLKTKKMSQNKNQRVVREGDS